MDPATGREINRLFLTLLRRLATTVLIMAVVSAVMITTVRPTRNVSVGVVFLSIVLGLLISFWRRVEVVFKEVKQIGMDKWKLRRYADAAFALEHFHRVGNMSFDRDGEAHYFLVLCYLQLGQNDKAMEIEAWMRRGRPSSEYTVCATAAISGSPAETAAGTRIGSC